MDRFIAVFYPIKHRTLCSRQRGRIIVSILILCTILVNLHHIPKSYNFTKGWLINEHCALFTTYFRNKIFPTYNTFIFSVLPITIIIILNFLISYKSLASRNQVGPNQTISSLGKKAKKTTMMLLIVTTTFVVLVFPFAVVDLLFSYYRERDAYLQAKYSLLLWYLSILVYINHCINFILYVSTNSSFRKDFRKLFVKDISVTETSFVK